MCPARAFFRACTGARYGMTLLTTATSLRSQLLQFQDLHYVPAWLHSPRSVESDALVHDPALFTAALGRFRELQIHPLAFQIVDRVRYEQAIPRMRVVIVILQSVPLRFQHICVKAKAILGLQRVLVFRAALR